METYAKLVIKNQKEWNIDRINGELQELGYPVEILNKVLFGAFITRKRLEEDAYNMKEDPEGLRQIVYMKYPITSELLESFFWNRMGTFIAKISCFSDTEKDHGEIVFNYAFSHKNDFNWAASENCSKQKLRSYGFRIKGG